MLLILAGITIASLTGENGILTRTQGAKEQTIIGEEKEQITLAYSGAMAETLGEGVNATDINNQFEKNSVNARASGIRTISVYFQETQHLYNVNGGKINGPTIGENVMTLSDMYNQAQADGCDDENCTNEKHLHVGDYVNYENPTSGKVTINTNESGLIDSGWSEDLKKEQTYEITSSQNQLKWRVMGINENGGIELIADAPMERNIISEWRR